MKEMKRIADSLEGISEHLENMARSLDRMDGIYRDISFIRSAFEGMVNGSPTYLLCLNEMRIALQRLAPATVDAPANDPGPSAQQAVNDSTGKKWQDNEVVVLYKGYKNGESIKQIQQRLKDECGTTRSESSISAKWFCLNNR